MDANLVFQTITNEWHGSQMLFPMTNKAGNRVNVVFNKDECTSIEQVQEKLDYWYSHEMKMVPID